MITLAQVIAAVILTLPSAVQPHRAPSAPKPIEYRAVMLKLPYGYTGCIPHAMNDAGEIVGELTLPRNAHGPAGRAFYWRRGKFVILPMLSGYTEGVANDINNSGEVVGTCQSVIDGAYLGLRSSGFVWSSGKISSLPDMPPGFETTAEAINDTGLIGGAAGNTASANMAMQSTTAFVLAHGKRIDMAPGHVVAIDRDDTVYGNVPAEITYNLGPNNTATIAAAKPFIWSSGSLKVFEIGRILSVNRNGWYLNAQTLPDSHGKLGPYHPPAVVRLFHDGVHVDEPDGAHVLGPDNIVGGWTIGAGDRRDAAIMSHGRTTDLQAMERVVSGNLHLSDVMAINAAGEILCAAVRVSDRRESVPLAVLLIPVRHEDASGRI